MQQAAFAQRLHVLTGYAARRKKRAFGVLDGLFEGGEVIVPVGDGEYFGLAGGSEESR